MPDPAAHTAPTHPMQRPSAATEQLRTRAHRAIPGGAHTYAKGDDQFPANAPAFIVRGKGSHVWDTDGREFVEYGSGVRTVTLGHAFDAVDDAVRASIGQGTNFCRPAPIEVECAEAFLAEVPTADMVKFTKDGSSANTAALKLARSITGRERVAYCADNPFFSYDDWFIGATGIPAGTTDAARKESLAFTYNDLDSVTRLFTDHPAQIAAVFLEPARTAEPAPGFLEGLRRLCATHGALLVFDEVVTGFRWARHGAQGLYGVRPDLSTWGKAIANGYSVSALAGSREHMERGGLHTDHERVFLLSTTHGAETPALAAAMATMRVYETEPVIETLHARGAQLRAGIEEAAEQRELQDYVTLSGRDCALLFGTRDATGAPSQAMRTLFLQELVRGGVLAPSFIIGYSHSVADVDRTIDAAAAAMDVYAKALEDGPEHFLVGPSVRPVYRPYNNR